MSWPGALCVGVCRGPGLFESGPSALCVGARWLLASRALCPAPALYVSGRALFGPRRLVPLIRSARAAGPKSACHPAQTQAPQLRSAYHLPGALCHPAHVPPSRSPFCPRARSSDPRAIAGPAPIRVSPMRAPSTATHRVPPIQPAGAFLLSRRKPQILVFGDYTILYYIVLYYIILCYIVLYCTLLYSVSKLDKMLRYVREFHIIVTHLRVHYALWSTVSNHM